MPRSRPPDSSIRAAMLGATNDPSEINHAAFHFPVTFHLEINYDTHVCEYPVKEVLTPQTDEINTKLDLILWSVKLYN